MAEQRSNWAGNVTYRADSVQRPTTVEQVQALVAGAGRVKAMGARHSFNAIGDTSGTLISLEHLDQDRAPAIDPEQRTVSFAAGSSYGQLARHLQRAGYALPNMASLPQIYVAGACATATHGSGEGNGVLATAVAALEVVTAGGESVVFRRDRDGEPFAGAVVGLGGLGIVTRLTLDIEPTYEMRQVVYENLPLAQLVAHFDAIFSCAYSVSAFTTWRNETIDQVWLKSRLDRDPAPPPDLFGATPARRPRHPIAGKSADSCTEQLGIPGPWYERLPHFRMGATPSSGDELQSEYLVSRPNAIAALRAVARLGERLAPSLQISEVRTIRADSLWMSPFYRQDCVGIHFTWRKDERVVKQLLPLIEAELRPLGARPHWGKLFTLPVAYVQSCYAKLADFRALLRSYDPQGKFRNAFLDTYIFGEGAAGESTSSAHPLAS
jgi:alditol oxidase